MTVRLNDELMRSGNLCFTVRAAFARKHPPQGDDLSEPLRTAKAVVPQGDDLFEPSRGVEVRRAIRCRVWFRGKKNARRFESISAMYRWVIGVDSRAGTVGDGPPRH